MTELVYAVFANIIARKRKKSYRGNQILTEQKEEIEFCAACYCRKEDHGIDGACPDNLGGFIEKPQKEWSAMSPCYFCGKQFSTGYYLRGRWIFLCDACYFDFLKIHWGFGYGETFTQIEVYGWGKNGRFRK